jgi:hypothetical protein
LNTSKVKVLRRPIESTQKAVIEMVTSSTSGPLVATPEARELISRLTAAVTDECTRVLLWF